MLKGMLSLLKNSIILGELIMSVNILMIPEMSIQKAFSLIPFGGMCYRNMRATANSFELPLHTLSISSILFLAWLSSSALTTCILVRRSG